MITRTDDIKWELNGSWVNGWVGWGLIKMERWGKFIKAGKVGKGRGEGGGKRERRFVGGGSVGISTCSQTKKRGRGGRDVLS